MKKLHNLFSHKSIFGKLLSRCPVYNRFSACNSRKNLWVGIILIVLILAIVSLSLGKGNRKINHRDAVIKTCTPESGQTWCAASQKCINQAVTFCPDKTDDFVNGLEKETKLKLVDGGQTDIVWNIQNPGSQVSDKSIKGEVYEASSIPLEQVKKIQKYLDSNMKLDDVNTVSGTAGGLRGYYKDNMICALDFRYKEMHMGPHGDIVPVSDSLNVKLKCGLLAS